MRIFDSPTARNVEHMSAEAGKTPHSAFLNIKLYSGHGAEEEEIVIFGPLIIGERFVRLADAIEEIFGA